MSGNIQITGAPTTAGPDGSVPLRREIRELQATSPDQFNLFVLALRELQNVDEQQMTSYYQIAGIHGLPYKPWNGVKGLPNFDFGGYCTHSSVLFVPWHRPYLALFEQALYAAAQGVAAKFPAAIRDRYVAAAKILRLPYWDFALRPPAGSTAFPGSLSATSISVIDTDGQTKQIRNPLHQFDFHPVNPSPGDFTATWSRYRSTVRRPDRSGNSQDLVVSRIIANETESLRRNVALILLSYHDFDAFSDNSWAQGNPAGTYGSLEDIHNEIHDKTGGGGHMSALEVSSFDPLFWLHHCNVDRLWAVWQDLNPDKFITPKPAPYTTFTTRGGTSETQDSPLSPFWDRSGARFWTSAQVKSSTTFGYAYPETQRWRYRDAATYRAALTQQVTALYGGNVFSSFAESLTGQPTLANLAVSNIAVLPSLAGVSGLKKAEPAVRASGVEGEAPAAHQIHAEGAKDQAQKPLAAGSGPEKSKPAAGGSASPIPAVLAHLAPGNTYTEWIVNVRALKHALGQTYRVLVFLGSINPDPSVWDLEYNCVGRVAVLGRAYDTQCSKCQDDRASNLQVTGTVPLTSALLQDVVAGRLADLTPEAVVPYLKAQLKWRVTLFGGEEKPVEEVPGLKISVCSTQVHIGDDGNPQYSGQYTLYREITAGQPGAIGDDES